jgi:2-succinyl-5-enolpyruvyl-6-hydroxy-3-cyclohexene-1-carboxylate synthase
LSVSQTILDIAEICVQQKVTHLILSPGSRNAPLALAFFRHPQMTTRIVPDERVAGYIAIGIAQSINQPVLLLSTSGTAVLNYGPAIAEAYYQQVPLIVLTADRPPEWIGQNDGQAIKQDRVFANHTKQSFQLPVDMDHEDAKWHTHRVINEAINVAHDNASGPVHINVPFREPFYPSVDQPWIYQKQVPVVTKQIVENAIGEDQWSLLLQEWQQATKILVVGGQNRPSIELRAALEAIQQHAKVPIVGDAISNLHSVTKLIKHPEHILGQSQKVLEQLQPDLLITLGGAVISKNLKIFLRKYPAKVHWHLQQGGYPADCFKSISRVIPLNPAGFFNQLCKLIPTQTSSDWYDMWQTFEQKSLEGFNEFIHDQEFNELQVIGKVLSSSEQIHLHLANSSVVRWADLFGISPETIEVTANRGTSGIDGCSSVAVGHSLSNQRQNLLITGDMAFFYDRNAFWHPYAIPNLKIVVINNHGGGIFRLVDGAKDQPELEELFVTSQRLSAKNTAQDFGMSYFYCDAMADLSYNLEQLFSTDNRIGLLEIVVRNNMAEIYKELKANIKNLYEAD